MPTTANSQAHHLVHTNPPTILIVDDDDYVHGALRAALRAFHANLVRAASATEGFELAAEYRPDLAIVDVGLPDADGYELTRLMRAESDLRSMRVLILTGHLPDEAAARDAGADAIVAKPFKLHEFLAVVREQLERARGRADRGTGRIAPSR